MSARAVGEFLGEMVDGLERRMGRPRAILEVARRSKMTRWTVEKLIGGRVKTITTDKYVRSHAAYLDWCLEDLKAAIEHREKRLAEAQGRDLLAGLGREIRELKARVRQMEKMQT